MTDDPILLAYLAKLAPLRSKRTDHAPALLRFIYGHSPSTLKQIEAHFEDVPGNAIKHDLRRLSAIHAISLGGVDVPYGWYFRDTDEQ